MLYQQIVVLILQKVLDFIMLRSKSQHLLRESNNCLGQIIQRITSVWTHVERVIGLFRNKYRTLQRILPVGYLITRDGGYTTVNKIVTVSSALCNICNSIVPIEQFLLLSLHIYCKQNNQLIIFNMECKMEVVASLLLTHT